jgi:hypothetical protein
MFREGDRNRVLLRFTLDDGYGEIDVSTLKAIRDRRLKRPEAEKALKEVCRAS